MALFRNRNAKLYVEKSGSVCENFDVIGIQRRFAASFSDKILFRNCPVFNYKEKTLEAITVTFILIPE